MTQIATIQGAPHLPSTGKTHNNENSNQFTPHLEKAVTEATQINTGTLPETLTPNLRQLSIDAPPLEATESRFESPLSNNIEPGKTTGLAEDNFIAPLERVNYDKYQPLLSADQEITVQPPGQDLLMPPRGIEISAGIAEQKFDTPFIGEKITIKTPEKELNLQAPGKHASMELTDDVPISTTSEKELPVLSEDKNATAFDKQEITIQSSERNPVVQVPGIDFEKGASGQNLNTELKGKRTDIQSSNPAINLQVSEKYASLEVITTEPPALAARKELSLFFQEKNGTVPFSQKGVQSPIIQKTDSEHFSQPLADHLDPPLKVDLKMAHFHNANTPVPAIGQNQTLLQQLQNIINSGNETGTVSIQAEGSSYSFQYRDVSGAKSGDISPGQIQEPGNFSEKPGPKIPALRQDMLGQYFEAKMNTREQGDSGPNTQANDQQNNANNQQASASPQPNSSLLPEQAGNFQHISTLMQDMQINETRNNIKPVILPSGTIVDEDNVIQQVVERFQVNNRGNDIKLNLKLHPEELGELKIDLTLREGSIKGNVVAQSQQIQEIIEKNMMKLRSILEDQGFTVEEILVTSESDSVPDFDFFEQHLSQQSDLRPSFTETPKDNNFDVALEDAVEQSVGSSSGVNIKA